MSRAGAAQGKGPDLEGAIAAALRAILPRGARFAVRGVLDVPWPRGAAEQAAGAACAAEALRRVGGAGAPERSPDGAPVWPRGIVGSVSHARRVAIAAVARTSVCAALGVDVEPVMSAARAARVHGEIATERERAGWASPERLTVLFSSKESVYKCLHPVTRVWFDFHDAEIVQADEDEGRVTLALLRDVGGVRRGTELVARFAWAEGHVVTAVTLAEEP